MITCLKLLVRLIAVCGAHEENNQLLDLRSKKDVTENTVYSKVKWLI